MSPVARPMDAITAEAIEIARIAGKLRAAERRDRSSEIRIVSAAEFANRPLLPRGEPSPDDTASRAFEQGLRFWARQAAPLLTYDQWEAMVWAVHDAVPNFPGDIVRFFETRFEGLTLRCGSAVLA